MDQLFNTLPKGLLAFLIIGAGILFIVLSDPPHTVCDSQIVVFKDAQKHFLFLDPDDKLAKVTHYQKLRDRCKMTNSPGGCFELFNEMKTMLRDFSGVPDECAPKVGNLTEVDKSLWEMAGLMVQLAWGEKPPTTYNQKFGWLDTADISLFCQLKYYLVEMYGQDAWAQFRERMMSTLPGAKNMARNQVWDLTILSENCSRYS